MIDLKRDDGSVHEATFQVEVLLDSSAISDFFKERFVYIYVFIAEVLLMIRWGETRSTWTQPDAFDARNNQEFNCELFPGIDWPSAEELEDVCVRRGSGGQAELPAEEEQRGKGG